MDYKKLDVWVQTRNLVKNVYVLTNGFPKIEQFALTSQIRRCVISISSNIAEGCGRGTNRETIHFLHIARGSLFELETQLILAKDLNYLTDDSQYIHLEIERTKKLLNGFIKYFKKL
ncbi:four helix bundle protein [Flavobacteriaceae bacterium D16]|nr:four helix bundle protein [Flavobacteriaceae bacterium D16]